MDNPDLIESIKKIILPLLEEKGLELVELKFLRAPLGQMLQLLVDRVGAGVSLGECADLNKRIGFILDEQGMINDKYILEVSSPGLDRPLKTKNDFLRSLGKQARFFLLENVNNKIEFTGVIKKVEGDLVYVEVEGSQWQVPISKIRIAKLVF